MEDSWFYEPQTKDPSQSSRHGNYLMVPVSVVTPMSIQSKKLRMLLQLSRLGKGESVLVQSLFWCDSMLYVGPDIVAGAIDPTENLDVVAAFRWVAALRFTFERRTTCDMPCVIIYYNL